MNTYTNQIQKNPPTDVYLLNHNSWTMKVGKAQKIIL